MKKPKQITALIIWIIVCSIPGMFGAQFDPGSWYEMLQKPDWTSPNWVFPVVWPILYLMMGISAWLLWRMENISLKGPEFRWFFVQLVLNGIWSWIFFGLHLIATGLAEILLLWVSVVFTIMLFWDRNRLAGALLIPYLLWISYASALNFAIWQLN